MYEILVENMTFNAYHGVYDWEATTGTTFRVDMRIILKDNHFSKDNMQLNLDYTRVVKLINEIAVKQRFKTLEFLAETLCQRCLNFTRVQTVDITLRKKVPKLENSPQWLGVHLVRHQK